MTPRQMNHINSITDRVESMMRAKYEKGTAEHGGNLWEQTPIQLIDNAIEEAIDQLTYLMTLRDKLESDMKTKLLVEDDQRRLAHVVMKNPCPKGGAHVWVVGPSKLECAKCGEEVRT